MRLIAATISTIFFCWGAYGQSAANPTSFVAASVKPAAPSSVFRCWGGPGSPDPGQFTCTNAPLIVLLTTAYGVKSYQIEGPDWLNSERFDIIAKIPAETTKEQYKLMLQNLLAERFQLTLHHQTRELPIYALAIGKGGPKMKLSDAEPAAASKKEEALTAPPPPPPPPPSAGLPERPKMDADGFPVLPPGMRKVTVNMMNTKTGRFRMLASHESMSHLADMLSNQLAHPVVDETGLNGLYDFTLEYAPGASIGPLPPPPPGVDGGTPPTANTPDAADLFSAIQAQIGLKLQQKKGPVDLLVIDHLEKVPTEN
jgi:uncharacterized protein (TIGR03435 family)